MKKYLFTSILLCGFGMGLMGVANAAPLPLCSTAAGLPCVAPGNDKEPTVEAAVKDATGSPVDLTLYGKSDDNAGLFTITTDADNKSGTWAVNDASILIDYLTVKASNEFAVYFIGGQNSGTWTTAGMVNNGGQQPALSHLSFWAGPSTAVPEPSGLLILGAGLLGLAMLGRRARRN